MRSIAGDLELETTGVCVDRGRTIDGEYTDLLSFIVQAGIWIFGIWGWGAAGRWTKQQARGWTLIRLVI
jgi:hypothetical protein